MEKSSSEPTENKGSKKNDSSGLAKSLRGVLTSWFSAGTPPEPAHQSKKDKDVQSLDYPMAFNMQLAPRTPEVITFATMRALADSYDLLRLVIETRKDQMAKLDWTFRPRKTDKKNIKEADQTTLGQITLAKAFFYAPDGDNDWSTWLRMLLEDLLVIDAPTLYVRRNRAGAIYGVEVIDGATIKRIIDDSGRTPTPPDPAYQQILHGLPAISLTTDELIYRPRNARPHKIYGFSPVEQVITTVNLALRRQKAQLEYYTEGTVPNLIFGVPKEWSAEQIRQFQSWWDSLGTGKHGTRFVPEGVHPINTREGIQKDPLDEWLARIICYAFSTEPGPLIAQVNRATAETQHEQSLSEGLLPLQNWVKGLINHITWNFLKLTDVEFSWVSEPVISPLEQAQINKIYLDHGVMTASEIRESLGLDPTPPVGTPEKSQS